MQPLGRSLPEVAAVAGFKADAPRGLAVVTDPAEFPRRDGVHGDVVRALLHLEDGVVTSVALESDAMDPMREDGRRDPPFGALALEDNVPINSQNCAGEKAGQEEPCYEADEPWHHVLPARAGWHLGHPVGTAKATLPWQAPQY